MAAKKATVALVSNTEIGGDVPTNGGQEDLVGELPYLCSVTVKGSADFIYHGWNPDAVDEKSRAAKGSKAKKSDNVESYVYRLDNGNLAIPGEYLRGAIVNAAKFRQDPRSPRKSAMDLTKAGVVSMTLLADLGKPRWDYEDKRRVVVQRSGVNRTRPAMKAGWTATFDLMVAIPEYIPPTMLHDLISLAGKLIGLGDFRPTYGRFQIVGFDTRPLE